MTEVDETATTKFHFQLPRARFLVLVALICLVLIWITPAIAAFVHNTDLETLNRLYGWIFLFVVFDAVIPIFPSESLLNAASALAAQDGSTILLWKVTLAGVTGAIVGDSLLYWLSRTVLRSTMDNRVDQALKNPKIAQGMQVMNRNAAILIVFGRFVPGLRFMVGATMGLTRFPYRRFLLWDVIGGTLWGIYTCVFAYLVASVIDGKPLVAALVAGVVTTGFLAILYVKLKKSWEQTEATPDSDAIATV